MQPLPSLPTGPRGYEEDAVTLKRPLYMQAGGGDTPFSYDAVDFRAILASVFNVGGVCNTSPADLKVTQRSAGANFSVDVAAGYAVIAGTDVAGQGFYLVQSTATVNLVVPPPPVSGTRVHRVVAQVRDKLHNGALAANTYDFVLSVLEDTGSGTPATPASALSLATVSVASTALNVSDSNITDTRVNAVSTIGIGRWVGSDALRPPAPVDGELIWRTDKSYYEVAVSGSWRPIGLAAPAARLGRVTTNQSITNNTTTPLQWNSEFEDTHGGHDNSTNNSRYTAPIDGLYQVTATVAWDSNSSGIREISLRVNGSTILDGNRIGAGFNITLTQTVSHLVRLTAGQYVEAIVWQNTGGSLAIDRTFHAGPLMDVVWMRP
ncbi:hypothetical protein [Actinomadura rubrisoli]|uniref:C1q domain-containing protein n=1 Tax=Actinomadura rubrisoli TaxID=2530368 RepID=A0A4R5CCD3_9ACTN|nr:hypothetical protein [Actinomadura rubrisoli]TDD97648.1 hypothetical protein E1298_01035 [Actinomadura rubrisoli]